MEDNILDIALNFTKKFDNPFQALNRFVDSLEHSDKRHDDIHKLHDIMRNMYYLGKDRGVKIGISSVIDEMNRAFGNKIIK